jgi:hypothetical protein
MVKRIYVLMTIVFIITSLVFGLLMGILCAIAAYCIAFFRLLMSNQCPNDFGYWLFDKIGEG